MLDAVFTELKRRRPEFANAAATWQDTLQPELERREEERRNIISSARSKTFRNAFFVLGGAIFLSILTAGRVPFFVVLVLGIIALVVASGAAWVPLMSMKSQTKQLVVGAAAEAFGFKYDTLHPDVSGISDWQSAKKWLDTQSSSRGTNWLQADRDGPAPTPAFDVLKRAKLMPGYDKRKFEDLIEGRRADAVFSLIECKLTEQQGSGKNRRTVTTFQGLLVHIEYPEHFLGRTLLARQGWWKGFFGDRELQKVDMVSKELEDNFTIYSNDQVEARALLTPDRMERLIALERHFKGGKLRGVFEGDHLTLALEAKNQFEAGSIWKPLVDPKRYVETLEEIGLVCDLIDGFLTREWVKDRL